MKKNNSASRVSIQDLFYDILIKIFLKLNVVELSVASMVCKSWNEICCNHLLWAKLDLSRLSSNAFNIPLLPGAWMDDLVSKSKLITCLKYALRLSNYNTSCLVFNFFIYLQDAELIFIAERYFFFFSYNCTQFVCYVGQYISPFPVSLCSSP